MKIKIEEIKIKKRVRKDLGNIEELAESIKRNGLLNPVIIDSNYTLIAGERRLQATKRLGYSQIEARIVNVEDTAQALEIEIEENTQRRSFSEEELINALTKLNKLRQPNIFAKFWRCLVELFEKIFKRG